MNLLLILQLAFWTPLAGALLIVATGRHAVMRDAVSLATAIMLFGSLLLLAPAVFGGARPALALLEPLPGLPLQLTLEPLGMLFALLSSSLWIITTLYAFGYMGAHQTHNLTRFHACFALSLWAATGMALAGNLLTLFVCYEILTLVTWPLVTHAGTPEAHRSGRIYLGLLLGTSISLLLLAIIWTWQLTGTLDFVAGGFLQDSASPVLLGVLLVLYVLGIGKAALMPFHRWLPAAMVAPTPVSALLHAVAVVKGGVFFILKVVLYVFGIDTLAQLWSRQWLLYAAALTILLASLAALRHDNLKVRLAYSTISQLGYIVAGALLATSAGIIGSAMHIVTHAFGKITLFFCAGVILVAANKADISQMRGLGRSMPFTMAAFLVAALSIIGLPPGGGTWSKWFLVAGSLETDQLLLLAVLLGGSLLSALYLLPIPVRGFFSRPEEALNIADHRVPLSCQVAIGLACLGCVLLFFQGDALYRIARLLLPGGTHAG
ncbi:MAG: proton-conducting transporter membrane subunit [Gammaproteobacteria bacterium]|jgi:multicomponent Na+:H+ antiporter subunit D